jgi:RimJ/RimL family protein N-acetyltransferase
VPIIARTPRLVLRSWTPDDAPALLVIYSDSAVTEHIPHVYLKDLAAAEAKIREMQQLEAANGCTLWAVDHGGELIGVCGFRTPEELGFAFRRDTWGQGYAREAGAACLRWAEEHGVRRIVASTRSGNVASRRVLDRLGFADTGRTSADGVWIIYERLTAPAAL